MPRLYRYKYDPNPRIQLAMANIWSAVIPESKKAVDKYFKEILADLKENLNSSLWRNRESRYILILLYVRLGKIIFCSTSKCISSDYSDVEEEYLKFIFTDLTEKN